MADPADIAKLVVGRAYLVEGMHAELWDVGHPEHGKPYAVAGRYLGWIQGTRRWHAFEVWHLGVEIGVLFMNESDLAALIVVEVPD